MDIFSTNVCVVGGGPAGLMCGFLLARNGINVIVVEKHKDFLRDFRGDTIHPSTLEVLHQLGVLEEFLKLPHQKISKFTLEINQKPFTLADLSLLKVHCPYIVLMPQWDFLNFIAAKAQKLPNFKLLMEVEAKDFILKNNIVTGIIAEHHNQKIEIQSSLVVAADGRKSILRDKSKLELLNIGAPMDVLWMRISRIPSDPIDIVGKLQSRKMLVMINRGSYWQCAYVIPKESFKDIKAFGLNTFKNNIIELAPFLKNRLNNELNTWDDVKILSVAVDRLKKWYLPNLLLIGDASHAMSPIGGIGINLAIQDAIATANILSTPLKENKDLLPYLDKIQKRRYFATKITQAFQVLVQNRVISKALNLSEISLPWALRFAIKFKFIRKIFASKLAMGFRPEFLDNNSINLRD